MKRPDQRPQPRSRSADADVPRTHPAAGPAPSAMDRPYCLLCGGEGVEKKQKWFCRRCGQLIQTCCD